MRNLSLFAAVCLPIAAACAAVGDQTAATGSPGRSDSPDASSPVDGSQAPSSPDGSSGTPPPPSSSSDAGTDASIDPFAPQPDTSEGLTNVSTDVGAILENGALPSACTTYWAGTLTDRKAMLLCGKEMFFYEGFATSGVPEVFVQFLIKNFPKEIGPGFTQLGMVLDPNSTNQYPLGLAPGAPLGSANTLAFTCASCHFGKLPDGRYAAGFPNFALDYGTLNLAIAVFPTVAAGLGDAGADDGDALKKIQPLLDEMTANPSLKTSLLLSMLPLLSAASSAPTFPAAAQHDYANWRTGTMDFFIEPLPFNDHVHTVSKISALWGMPSADEVTSSGMGSSMIGWTGSTVSLLNFARGFVDLGGGVLSDWPDDKLGPLVEYVQSLRAPSNPRPDDASVVAHGADVFRSEGCLSCHDAPRGGGFETYDYATIGTDPQMKLWADPDQTGQPEYNIRFQPGDKLTHAIKSPRLVGLWSFDRFLHNGSVDTLESLLCTSGPRGDITEIAYGNQGHTYGCELGASDKAALVAYLKAH